MRVEGTRAAGIACPRCGNALVWWAETGQWFCETDRLAFPGATPSRVPPAYGPPSVPPTGIPGYWTPPIPQPKPRGTPSRGLFLLGAVGHFIAAGASLAFGIFLMVGFFYLSLVTVIAAGILFIGLLGQLFAFYGMRRNYGSSMGIATFAYGLAAALVFFVAMALAYFFARPSYSPYYYMSALGLLLLIIGVVVLGVLFILEGVAFILTRHFMGNPAASTAAGVIFIVGGSLVASFLLALFGGFIVLVPAFIIGGIVLTTAPLPLSARQPP